MFILDRTWDADGPRDADGPQGADGMREGDAPAYQLALAEPALGLEYHAMTVRNLDRLKRWEPWAQLPQTPELTRSFLEAGLRGYANGEQIPLVLVVERQLAGSLTLRIDRADRTAALGYWIDREHEGHGIMRRACRDLIAFGRLSADLDRIEARTSTVNVRSQTLLSSLGFVREGTLRNAQAFADGSRDIAIYGLVD